MKPKHLSLKNENTLSHSASTPSLLLVVLTGKQAEGTGRGDASLAICTACSFHI